MAVGTSQPAEFNYIALLMQLLPILLLFVGVGRIVICGFIANHLAKTRRINRTCAVFAGIFGGITALLLIGMLERTGTGIGQPPARAEALSQNHGQQQ